MTTQTVYDVGDPITSRLKLGVTPDGSTGVSVIVTDLDGITATAGPPTGPVNIDEYTVQWTAAKVTDYRAVWTVTGTGAGVQTKVYVVRALPTGYARPTWAPTLADVADKVPTRTLDQSARADGVFLGTFTGNTTPTDEEAQRVIDRATAAVSAAVGATLPATLYGLATDAAAWQAAADVELAYPDRNADVNVQPALQARASRALDELVSAQAAATGQTGAPVLLTEYAFPAPAAWPADTII